MTKEQKQFLIRNKSKIKKIILEALNDGSDKKFNSLEIGQERYYAVNCVHWALYECLFKHKEIFDEMRGATEPSFSHYYGSREEYVEGLSDALWGTDEKHNIVFYDWNKTLITG